MNSLYLENSTMGKSVSILFSIFFCSYTANEVLVDLADHCPVDLAVVLISSFSSPEFVIFGDTSLLEQLLPSSPE